MPTQSGAPPAVVFPAMSVFCTAVLVAAVTPPPPPPELGRLEWFPVMVQLVIVDWLSEPVRVVLPRTPGPVAVLPLMVQFRASKRPRLMKTPPPD